MIFSQKNDCQEETKVIDNKLPLQRSSNYYIKIAHINWDKEFFYKTECNIKEE